MKEFTKEHTLQVKGVAIMLLLFYHLFHEEWVLEEMQVNYAPLSKNVMLTLSGFGNICVAIFVMLTAYGITRQVLSIENVTITDLCKQSTRRFFKLMGNFFCVYLTINLICFSFFDYASLYGKGKQGILFLLCDATGLSHMLGTPTLNETWWYMEIAYVLIFLVPFLALLVKKMKNSLILLGFLIPFFLQLDADIERYLFVAVIGVCMANGGWIEKVMNSKIKTGFYWLIGIIGIPCMILVRQNAVVQDYFLVYVDAFVSMVLIMILALTVGKVPIFNKILAFLGKHSMNIFLMHTFLYLLVFRQYIYYFHYAFASFVILLILSLLYSVILEFLKKQILKIGKKLWEKQICAKGF